MLRIKRKIPSLLVAVITIGICVFLVLPHLHREVSAQELLQEAVQDGAPTEDIFYQQASQGYYADALATARLISTSWPDKERELSGFQEILVKIRAENGDIQGAKEMIKSFYSESDARAIKATREIAFVQANAGDLNGALETGSTAGATNDVLEEYGNLQIQNGDFDGALKTAEQVNERSAYNLFYALGDALRQRSQQKRLRVLASHMTDRKLAAEFAQAARFTLWLQPTEIIESTPCDIAWGNAMAGKFDDAYRLIENNNCKYIDVNIVVKQYESDPVEAERQLSKISDKEDRTIALAEMSEAAAKKGNIADALRLADASQKLSNEQDSCRECVRAIARAWTLKGQPKIVLRWARSRPTPIQRAYALLGMAEALGHPRLVVTVSPSTVGP